MYNYGNRKNPKNHEYLSESVSEIPSDSSSVWSCGECGEGGGGSSGGG